MRSFAEGARRGSRSFFENLIGERNLARDVSGGERPDGQHGDHLLKVVFGRRVDGELLRGVAPGVGQSVDLALVDFSGERQHGAQHFAER